MTFKSPSNPHYSVRRAVNSHTHFTLPPAPAGPFSLGAPRGFKWPPTRVAEAPPGEQPWERPRRNAGDSGAPSLPSPAAPALPGLAQVAQLAQSELPAPLGRVAAALQWLQGK